MGWTIISPAAVEKNFQTDLSFFISASPGTGYIDPILLSTAYGYGDGSHHDGTVIPARNFSLVGILAGDDPVDYRTKRKALAALCRRHRQITEAPVKIRYAANGNTVQIEAYFAGGLGGDGDRQASTEKIGLRWRADDPFFYNTSQTITNLNFGVSIPAAANTVVTNNGDANCYPQIVVTGPGTILQIKNVTTGKTLALNAALIAGEVLTFDLSPDQKTVTSGINGDMVADLPIPGDIGTWYLAPGANTISTAIDNAGAAAEVRFYDTYESIDGVG